MSGKQMNTSEEYQRKQEHIKSLVQQTFGTPSGKALLEYLAQSYLDCPVFNASVSGDKQATYAAYREGENSVIRKLKVLLEDTE